MTKQLTRSAGSLTLTVHSEGERDYEGREIWGFAVTDGSQEWRGSDLRTGVGFTESPETVLSTLCAFLEHYGECYARNMEPDPELSDVPEWVQEACYVDSDELGILSVELLSAGRA